MNRQDSLPSPIKLISGRTNEQTLSTVNTLLQVVESDFHLFFNQQKYLLLKILRLIQKPLFLILIIHCSTLFLSILNV